MCLLHEVVHVACCYVCCMIVRMLCDVAHVAFVVDVIAILTVACVARSDQEHSHATGGDQADTRAVQQRQQALSSCRGESIDLIQFVCG